MVHRYGMYKKQPVKILNEQKGANQPLHTYKFSKVGFKSVESKGTYEHEIFELWFLFS